MGRPRLHRRVRRSAPAPEEVRVLARHPPWSAWHRHLIHEGSKGPLVAEFAVLRGPPPMIACPAFVSGSSVVVALHPNLKRNSI